MTSIWTVRRSATDTKLSGLCGGLAQHWGVDPVLVRVAFALLALSGGVGLILYVAGWLLIPVEGKDRSTVDVMFGDSVSRWPRELWLTLVVIACIGAFAAFGALTPFSIGPAVVIAIIWYFGFYKPRQAKRTSTPPPTPAAVAPAPAPFSYPGESTPFTQAAEAWARRIQENSRAAAAAPWPTPPPVGSRSLITEPNPEWGSSTLVEPLSERQTFLAEPDPVGLYAEPVRVVEAPVLAADRPAARRLRLVALIVIGLAMSGLGVLDYFGTSVPLAAYLATALLFLGLTLVAGTWVGRARGILPLGLLLTVAVLAVTAVGPRGVSMPAFVNQSRAYASITQLPPAGDSVDVGNLTVDLSALVIDRDIAYRASIDAGNLRVTVPADTRVVVHYSADAGAVTTFGTAEKGGTELKGEVADPATAQAGQPTLTLDLSVDVGKIEVQR